MNCVSDDLSGVEVQADHWNEGKGIKLEFDEENPTEVTGDANFDNFEEFFDDVDENNDDEDYDPTYEIKEQVKYVKFMTTLLCLCNMHLIVFKIYF